MDKSTKMNSQPDASSSLMNAIAYGVQVRLDEHIGFSRRVTEETVNTARSLGIPRSVIEK